MSIDAAIAIAWDVLKSVVAPIKRQFGYVIYSKRHAQDLQNEVKKLAHEVDRVHNLAEEARNNVRNVYDHVTESHASAEKALKEAQDLLGDIPEASKTCCYGTLPDPKCRYQFSRKAKDNIEVIQRLTQRCSGFKELNDISSCPPAPGNVASFASTSNKVRDNDVFESRASIIRDIVDALADESNSVVGVYGMGGIGKSTLLGEVEGRIRKEKSFDWVAKADVSENEDIKRIQGEIADSLGLTEIKNKETISGRAGLLHKRLEDEERKRLEDERRKRLENEEPKRLENEEKAKKVLIILDNLWKGLDLKSVGIPCGPDNKVIGCKLLLTSRFQDVLRREMGCDRDFRLEELEDEEAKRLFERTVGDKVHHDPFRSLVNEAVHKCAGLPFLIIAMAKIFKDAEFYEWKDVLTQIEKSTDIGIKESINKMLQLTYDHFKGKDGEEVKSILRLCVIYGVSKPSLENLVKYAVGLRLFREDSNMEEVRNRLRSLIRRLKASSLLLDDIDDEDDDGFKIHDLVRGFVASIASREEPLIVWKDNDESVMELPKYKLKSCTALCFSYVEMEQLPEELDCPETQIFLLFTNNDSLKVPDSYFNSMRKLMVLHLSQVCLTHSPSPFKLLEDLHTLCLDGCSLEDIAMIGELKGLHILSFVNSNIHRLPKEIGQLVELRLLDLSECSQLEIIEPGVLGSLMKLEELYMLNSFDKWNAMEQTPPTNPKLIELGNRKNLHTLHVSIPDLRMLPKDLNVKKLTKYNIRIGGARCYQRYKGSSVLELKLHSISDSLQKRCIQTLLGKTDHLLLDGLNGIESICSLSHEGFKKLKHLYVKYSPSTSNNQVDSQVAFFDDGQEVAFPSLETLQIMDLDNIKIIWDNQVAVDSFHKLKSLKVERCNRLLNIVPSCILGRLKSLESLEVQLCHMLEVVFKLQPLNPLDGHPVADLPLKRLELDGLRELKCVWDKELHTQVKFQCLRFVTVSRCESLTSLFPASVAIHLTQLEELEISVCGIVELIEKEDIGVPRFVFPKLTSLKLRNLTQLRCIYIGKYVSHWLALKTLEIYSCDKVEILASHLENDMPFDKQPLFLVEKVAFPSLETLQIVDMDNMEIIWDNQVVVDSFPKLKSLEVWICNKLLNIVPSCILGRLKSLESLEVRSCDLLEVVFKLQPLNPPYGHPVANLPLKRLKLNGLPKLKCVWDKELHTQVKFQCLRFVAVSGCNSLTSLFPASVAIHLTQLEKLEISECGIVELIEKEVPIPKVVFPRLTSLKLTDLIELKCIYTRVHALCWPGLKNLEVQGCNKVEILAAQPENEMPLRKQPLFLIEKGTFRNLQELKLDLSGQMEIWHGYFHDGEFFNKLRVLELHHFSKKLAISTCCFVQSLANLEKLVVRESYQEELRINIEAIAGPSHELEVILPFSFQHLKTLEMSNCNGLSPYIILPFSGFFQHLKTLDMSFCDGLSNIFTLTIARNLVELTKLRIINCEMLTEVICDEEGEEGLVVAFNQLKYIELDGLTRLRCFSSIKYTLMFPLLEDVIVSGCPHIKFFSRGPIEAPKLERVQVSTRTTKMWLWKENLNITIQNLFE